MSAETLETVGFSATVWVVNIVGFLLLLAALSKWLWRPLSDVVETRRRQIAEQQVETERLLAEAQAQMSEARARAAELERQAEERRLAIFREAADEAERLVREAREEAVRLQQQAREEAEALRLRALDDAKREVASLAGAMAQRLLAVVLDEERQKAVLEAAVEGIEDLVAQEGRN
ncbi:MAG: ATP synthase F0 subunit B [Armatimonadetes bacterium]|nr:ATP synthase F0 subunit B [Armatimonadota bacterium]